MKRINATPKLSDDAAPKVREATDGLAAARRLYRAPRITSHGPIVRIALGGSPGVGDSANTFVERPG